MMPLMHKLVLLAFESGTTISAIVGCVTRRSHERENELLQDAEWARNIYYHHMGVPAEQKDLDESEFRKRYAAFLRDMAERLEHHG